MGSERSYHIWNTWMWAVFIPLERQYFMSKNGINNSKNLPLNATSLVESQPFSNKMLCYFYSFYSIRTLLRNIVGKDLINLKFDASVYIYIFSAVCSVYDLFYSVKNAPRSIYQWRNPSWSIHGPWLPRNRSRWPPGRRKASLLQVNLVAEKKNHWCIDINYSHFKETVCTANLSLCGYIRSQS